MSRKSHGKTLALGAAIAALAGFITGILTAPKSGKETRQDIKDTAQKGLAEAEKDLTKAHDELDKLLTDLKGKGSKLSGKADSKLTGLMDSAKSAKTKAGEVLSAVRAGTAEDRELQKALTEANKALTHLRKYLKK